jgi:hypothetical protein
MAASVFIKAAFLTLLTLVSVFSVSAVVKSLNSTTGPQALADSVVADDNSASSTNQLTLDTTTAESSDDAHVSQALVFQDDDQLSEAQSTVPLVSGALAEHDDDHEDRWESRKHRSSSHRFDD